MWAGKTQDVPEAVEDETSFPRVPSTAMTAAVLTTLLPSLPVFAASGGDPWGSALAAYAHYFSLLIITALVTMERLLVKPDMCDDDQQLLTYADIGLGVIGLPLVYSGYLRVTQYGKGWEFYQHEPIFWVKIALVGVFGAASFFTTTTVIKRSIEQRNTGAWPPMSEKLAKRMQSVLNAELTALLSIPLAATVMARGIGYNESIPWPAEAALAAVVFAGASFKYIKEALTFEDDEKVVASSD